MFHSYHHHSEPTPVPTVSNREVESVDSETTLTGVEAFKARMYAHAKENGQLTQIDELRHIFETGNQDELDTHIDDLVYEALSTDEEFLANIQTLKEGRQTSTGPKDEDAIRVRQNEIFNEYKKTIVSIAGLPDGLGLDEYEVAKDRVQNLIKDTVQSGSPQNVLKALGILKVNEEGSEIFAYPNGLFPAETNKKWDLYLASVREHLRKERGVVAGTLPKEELETTDRMRRLAHNSVTTDVNSILGLDKLPESEWSYEKTRNLVAKMRDERYPTVETAEKARTTDQVLRAANALGVLGTKISGMK